MLYMVVETFRNGDSTPVYQRFRERGRMMPEGVEYVASWVTSDLTQCYQVMECQNEALLREWMSAWEDLVDFQYTRVITSAEASAAAMRREPH